MDKIDYSGQKIGDLTIIDKNLDKRYKRSYWNYVCVCGKSGVIRQDRLKKEIVCFHKEDVVGKTFGRWKVIKEMPNKKGKRIVKCECQCEKHTIRDCYLDNLRSGKSLSCGCGPIEKNTKHGMSDTRLYNIHKGLLARCRNPNHRDYSNYGGRGIRVCKEWGNFINFYNWAITHGYLDNLTLERIDVNQGYNPDNCKWVTMKEQERNKRNTIYVITPTGEMVTLSELSEKYNLRYNTLEYRYKAGWSFEELISPPCKSRRVQYDSV